MPEIEQQLRELGSLIDYPRTPALAAAVRTRLQRPRWQVSLGARRLALAVVLMVALGLAGALAASPGARDAVAGWLGLRGVTIQRVKRLPSPSPLPQSPQPGSIGERLRLGEPVTIEALPERFQHRVLMPTKTGRPDEVYVRRPPAGGAVTFVFLPRPGYPAAAATGVGLLVTEFQADLDPNILGKLIGPDTRLEQLQVNGAPGAWLEGKPHAIFYRDPSGNFQQDDLRLASNTLLWNQAGLLVRIECSCSRGSALELAASMR